MNKYVNVFWFNVVDKVKEGHEVFVIDRELHEIFTVSTLPVKTMVGIFANCEKEEYYGRYEFYYISEEENKEDESGI